MNKGRDDPVDTRLVLTNKYYVELLDGLEQLSQENKSTQNMLVEVRILLDTIKAELTKRRNVGYW